MGSGNRLPRKVDPARLNSPDSDNDQQTGIRWQVKPVLDTKQS